MGKLDVKLLLTDLQGSECLSKNVIEEKNIEEQKLINKSLIALGIVVNNLSINKKENFTLCLLL